MRQALEGIYREHRQGLFTLALSVTRSAHQAEDAVQVAFERLWRVAAPIAGDRVAYVYAAVRNAAIDLVRRGQSRQQAESAASAESIYNGATRHPAGEAMATEAAAVLRRAVDGLPDEQRQAVVLRIYGGLSFEQMAQTLDEPMGTVASRYRRAIEALRAQTEGLL